MNFEKVKRHLKNIIKETNDNKHKCLEKKELLKINDKSTRLEITGLCGIIIYMVLILISLNYKNLLSDVYPQLLSFIFNTISITGGVYLAKLLYREKEFKENLEKYFNSTQLTNNKELEIENEIAYEKAKNENQIYRDTLEIFDNLKKDYNYENYLPDEDLQNYYNKILDDLSIKFEHLNILLSQKVLLQKYSEINSHKKNIFKIFIISLITFIISNLCIGLPIGLISNLNPNLYSVLISGFITIATSLNVLKNQTNLKNVYSKLNNKLGYKRLSNNIKDEKAEKEYVDELIKRVTNDLKKDLFWKTKFEIMSENKDNIKIELKEEPKSYIDNIENFPEEVFREKGPTLIKRR